LTTDVKTITITATNLLSGDEFEATLDAEGVAALVPAGFAEGATSVAGFYGFLQDAYGQETGTVAVLDEVETGAFELTCTSREVVSGDPAAAAARRTVALKPDATPSDAMLRASSAAHWSIGAAGLMGSFVTVDGRYGQITSIQGLELGTDASAAQFKLRWLDDTTESEWFAKEELQQMVGSRLALTDNPATAVHKSFVSSILIPTPGRYTSDLRVQLSLLLKTRATAEVRHQIGLRTLRRICVSEMEAQRVAMERQQAEMMRALQAMQQQVDAMRREQGATVELCKELAVLHRWHVEPLVYGRGYLGSALPCSRDHPELAASLQIAAMQVALPQITDAGIRALWEAGLRSCC
jgi:hypothetical protein